MSTYKKIVLITCVILNMVNLTICCVVWSLAALQGGHKVMVFLIYVIGMVCSAVIWSIINNQGYLNNIIGRIISPYNDQKIRLDTIYCKRTITMRLNSVWDKSTSDEYSYDIVLYYKNVTFQSIHALELTLSQARRLYTQLGLKYFEDDGVNRLGQKIMFKHEFDTLMIAYAIDMLTELQEGNK